MLFAIEKKHFLQALSQEGIAFLRRPEVFRANLFLQGLKLLANTFESRVYDLTLNISRTGLKFSFIIFQSSFKGVFLADKILIRRVHPVINKKLRMHQHVIVHQLPNIHIPHIHIFHIQIKLLV
jgi:hypothetical protein